MWVFYDSRFKRWLCPITCGALNQKRQWETKKPDKSAVLCTLTLNFYRSLYCACKNESIIYFLTFYASWYKSIIEKSTRLQVIPQQSTQNTEIREKPVNFFSCSTRASPLASAVTLLTQVPLQKFPFLYLFIPPCSDQGIIIMNSQ